MKKQYIKPFVNVHTLKVESVLLGTSYSVKALNNDATPMSNQVFTNSGELNNINGGTEINNNTNFGIVTKWTWGGGNGSDVD